ncbi:MAG: glycosyltransferase [Saprospiraceae bacterium]
MNPLKICILTTSDLFYDQRMLRIIQSLIDANFTVICYSLNKSNKQVKINNLKNSQISTLFKSSWLFYAEYNFKLLVNLLFQKVDIIYSVDADTLLAGSIAKKLKFSKLIYDAHEFFEESPEIINKLFIKKVWSKITQFGVNSADLCLTVGSFLAQILSNKFGKKFHTIRNISSITFNDTKTLEDQAKVIWYQGVLNIGRGLEQMIECMIDLKEYIFILAGDGDISDKLKLQVNQAQLQERVIFLGKLSPQELQKQNQKARIGINLLSSNSKNYYYSLANRTFDFIHSGIPAIHMNFPEYSAIFQEFEIGVMIENLEKTEIIAAIEKLNDAKFYTHCKAQCLLASHKYTWNIESSKLMKLINMLFKEKHNL